MNPFSVNKNVLLAYFGDDEQVIIPDGITTINTNAFRGKKLKSIQIPEGVETIGSFAFRQCENLEEISLPSTLKVIGVESFGYCNSLRAMTLPESLELIDSSAFINCSNLEYIYIPPKISEIKDSTFSNCLRLKTVTGAESVKKVSENALVHCDSLHNENNQIIFGSILIGYFGENKIPDSVSIPDDVTELAENSLFSIFSKKRIQNVTLSESIRDIHNNAFVDVKYVSMSEGLNADAAREKYMPANMNMPKDYLKNYHGGNTNIIPLLLNTVWEHEKTVENCFWLFIHFPKKKNITSITLPLLQSSLSETEEYLLYALKSGEKENHEGIAVLLCEIGNSIKKETIDLAVEVFTNEKEKKLLKILEASNVISTAGQEGDKQVNLKSEDTEKLEKGLRPDEKVIEKFVEEMFIKPITDKDITIPAKPAVFYRNSKLKVRDDVLHTIFYLYMCQFISNASVEHGLYNAHKELNSETTLSINKNADYIYTFIDPTSFDELLLTVINGTKYRDFVLSFGRFAGNEIVEKAVKQIKKYKKGSAKEKYWANNIEKALILNETPAAMKHYDSIKKLEQYAAFRNISAQELKDSRMIPDFGFDENGEKKYQIGDINLSVKVLPDLNTELYDCNAGKIIKSIPSKGADPTDIKKLKEEYTAFKKEIKNFAEDKLSNIKQLHLSGASISKDVWKKVYVTHPVVRVLSEGIVWSDGEKHFIPFNNKIIDVYLNDYDPGQNIYVANALEMGSEDIKQWQRFFIDHSIKQPFEQVWEPILTIDSNYDWNRFVGLTLSSKERNEMKKKLKEKGIDVYSDTIESEYDHRARSYYFALHNTMHFGNYVDVDYTINESDKTITIESIKKQAVINRATANAILVELEKALMKQNILNDNDENLSRTILDLFTLAQIQTFISLANDNGSTKCKAILMNYKNESYPEFNIFDELTLDL